MLWAMRKDPSYFENKLRVLHKTRGLRFLRSQCYPNDKSRDWFRGFHTFQSPAKVEQLFRGGKPLSCFCVDGNRRELHVAVLKRYNFEEESNVPKSHLSYLTFTYNTSVHFTHETGMHFCQFELKNGVQSKEKGELNITDFAIMLPYKRGNMYIGQYTLIYSDWEVLICGNDQNKKGHTPVCKWLFDSVVNNHTQF